MNWIKCCVDVPTERVAREHPAGLKFVNHRSHEQRVPAGPFVQQFDCVGSDGAGHGRAGHTPARQVLPNFGVAPVRRRDFLAVREGQQLVAQCA